VVFFCFVLFCPPLVLWHLRCSKGREL